MKHRKLGKTNLLISPISLGTGSIAKDGGYSFGSKDISDLYALLEKALELKINHIDTAPIYGFRHIENELGKINKDLLNHFFISSKGGLSFSGRKSVRIDNSPAMLGSMLNETLKSLKKDVIDFYFIHWPDPKTPLEESVLFLEKQKKLGKIKFIGLSNFDLEKVPMEILKSIDLVQNESNIIEDLSVSSKSHFELTRKLDLGTFVYGLFGKGSLAKTNLNNLEDQDYRKKPHVLEKLFELKKKSETLKPTLKMCLSILENPKIHSGIVGVRNIKQLEEIAALEL